MSDWSTVAVATLPAVAAIAAAWFSGNRQERMERMRLESDRARLTDEASRWQHEQAAKRGAQRLAAYQEFLDLAYQFNMEGRSRADDVSEQFLREWTPRFNHALNAVALFGGSKTRRAAEDLGQHLLSRFGSGINEMGGRQFSILRWDDEARRVFDVNYSLTVNSMRTDLAAVGLIDADPAAATRVTDAVVSVAPRRF